METHAFTMEHDGTWLIYDGKSWNMYEHRSLDNQPDGDFDTHWRFDMI